MPPAGLVEPPPLVAHCDVHGCVLQQRLQANGEMQPYCIECDQSAVNEAASNIYIPDAKRVAVRYVEAAAPMPLDCEELEVAVAAPPQEGQSPVNSVLGKILALAREIGTFSNWVGYSAFVCFAIINDLRPFMWEGENRIDLIAHYAPWAENCTKLTHIDGVVCCLVSHDGGNPKPEPVTAHHPLHECKHFLAALQTSAPMGGCVGIEGFYQSKGVVILGTVIDGNCGLDVMCNMKGVEASPDNIKALRLEIHDYIIQKAREPYLHELMVATGELTKDELDAFRAVDFGAGGQAAIVEAPQEIAAHAENIAVAEQEITAVHLEALRRNLGMQDDALLASLARALPPAILDEQVQRMQKSKMVLVDPPRAKKKFIVNPNLVISRMQTAQQFDEFLRATYGWEAGNARLPRDCVPKFIANCLDTSYIQNKKTFRRNIINWYDRWKKDGRQHVVGPKGRLAVVRKKPVQNKRVNEQRRRVQHPGRPPKCQWLRQRLYEWWTGVRYAIDWEVVKTSLLKKTPVHRQSLNKAMGRYSRGLVKQKANQLQQDYCTACMIRGTVPRVVNITCHWLKNWEGEFGLSMRKANRKYKVPKSVMAQRLEVAWMNVARIRAFCIGIHGYDPDMYNFDQSPFHNNESGSQNTPTLAVAGGKVPLIENHSATRQRWTLNGMTCSNVDRLMEEGPPPAELAFKGAAPTQLRLRKHIDGRGYGKWLTVRTTDSASYKTPDIIDFLDMHLPEMSSDRRWRILIADDFSAHHSPEVFNLCWKRGYVLIVLGGGITPVIQTCDTDYNQAVKREYITRETDELIRQMQDGAIVPSCAHETCIDMMAEVLQNMALHFNAAKGYKKTGLTVALDGSEDQEICREAGVFFREQGMRDKINAAVASVEAECSAGRMPWTKKNAMLLIEDSPKHRKIDAILRKIEDGDTGFDDNECPYVEDDAPASDSESECDVGDPWALDRDHPNDMLETAFDDDGTSGPHAAGSAETEETGSSCMAVAETSSPPDEKAIAISTLANESVEHSAHVIRVFENAISSLKEIGQMRSVVSLENDVQKERRRIRHLAREDPDVVLALTLQRNEENARQRKRLREIQDEKRLMARHKDLKRQNHQTMVELANHRKKLKELENLADARKAAKVFTLDDLGFGAAGIAAQKTGKSNRMALMDRMKTIGTGLTGAQQNDFGWFKHAYDARGEAENGEYWPEHFAQQMQSILDEVDKEARNAFSLFVHRESTRLLLETPALRLIPSS